MISVISYSFYYVGDGYDQLCCPASPKLLLGLDLGLGCDKIQTQNKIK